MKAIVTGGSSGLGAEIVKALSNDGWEVEDWSIETDVDVADVTSIRDALTTHTFEGDIGLIVNCAGVNYINWHEALTIEEWDRVMNVNARAPWLVVKEALRSMAISDPATVVNIISNASHMPMTASAAYNASKGAAHILTQQMARELLPRYGITVFGLSPNRMAGTFMSRVVDESVSEVRGWSLDKTKKRQKEGLPTGQETDPAIVAEFLAFLLSKPERHKQLHGCILPYGA